MAVMAPVVASESPQELWLQFSIFAYLRLEVKIEN
jgi:hypothetical protein